LKDGSAKLPFAKNRMLTINGILSGFEIPGIILENNLEATIQGLWMTHCGIKILIADCREFD